LRPEGGRGPEVAAGRPEDEVAHESRNEENDRERDQHRVDRVSAHLGGRSDAQEVAVCHGQPSDAAVDAGLKPPRRLFVPPYSPTTISCISTTSRSRVVTFSRSRNLSTSQRGS